MTLWRLYYYRHDLYKESTPDELDRILGEEVGD